MTEASAPQILPPQAPPPRASPFRASLEAITAYEAGMSIETAKSRFGRDDFVKLASNENLFGPSPAVYEAIRDARQLELYPDPYCHILRAEIGDRLGVSASRVIMGAGSETLIDICMRALLEPGDTVVLSSPTFPLYAITAGTIGARLVDVGRKANFDLDIDATIEALRRERAKLLIVCTPNNPTGNAIGQADLERLISATPRETFVLFDEAYHEFNDHVDARGLLEAWGGRWLLLRTFSKAYALASCRVGYGVASDSEIVGYLDRLRPAFNVAALSQIAARAAWADQAHLKRTVGETIGERERMHAALDDLRIRRTPSKANFVLVESGVPVARSAERLLSRGLIVRPIPVGPTGWLRITIGRRQDNDRLLGELPWALAGDAS